MLLPQGTLEKIKAFFKGEISNSPNELDRASRDTSLFTVTPSLVVAPKDVDDVKNIVRFVAEENAAGRRLTLTARAAGTDMTGGPLSEGIIVDFNKHFTHLKELGDDSAVVEPGMFYRDFEKETLKKNLLLPSYPASRELCTVGGMVANNGAGEKTLSYGKTEKFVKNLKVVLRDGNEYSFGPISLQELTKKKLEPTLEGDIYRQIYDLVSANEDLLEKARPKVSKNSSGYLLWNVLDEKRGTFDLTKLFAGSQGTLGFITEITFKLVRPRTHSRLLVIFINEMNVLGKLVNRVLEFKPESFESYDDHTFRVAMRLFPQIVKRMGGDMIKLALQFIPEFFMVVTGGVPKLVLLIEFTGDTDEEAFKKALDAEAGIKDFGLKTRITKTEDEATKYWVMRRESFALLRQHSKHLRTAPFIDDLVVRPEVLPEFLPKLYQLLDQYPLIYTVAGHMGDANFHIIPLMDMTDPKSIQIIKELMPKVFLLIRDFGGSNTAEHNDGLIRTAFLPQMFGKEVYGLFEQTKKIFDPMNMFNPGKKVNGDLEYSLAHIETAKN